VRRRVQMGEGISFFARVSPVKDLMARGGENVDWT